MRERHGHPAGAAAQFQHRAAHRAGHPQPERHVATAERAGVLPVVERRVVVPAVPAFSCGARDSGLGARDRTRAGGSAGCRVPFTSTAPRRRPSRWASASAWRRSTNCTTSSGRSRGVKSARSTQPTRTKPDATRTPSSSRRHLEGVAQAARVLEPGVDAHAQRRARSAPAPRSGCALRPAACRTAGRRAAPVADARARPRTAPLRRPRTSRGNSGTRRCRRRRSRTSAPSCARRRTACAAASIPTWRLGTGGWGTTRLESRRCVRCSSCSPSCSPEPRWRGATVPTPLDDPTPQTLDEFKAAAARVLDETGVPGAGIALVNVNGTEWAGGVGWADRDRQVPVTADTHFRAGSVSKTFVALALVQLYEDGKLDLDAVGGIAAAGGGDRQPVGGRHAGDRPPPARAHRRLRRHALQRDLRPRRDARPAARAGAAAQSRVAAGALAAGHAHVVLQSRLRRRRAGRREGLGQAVRRLRRRADLPPARDDDEQLPAARRPTTRRWRGAMPDAPARR